MSETSVDGDIASEVPESESSQPVPMPPYLVRVDQLSAHPGNVREDLDLSPQFLASVADSGVRIPLLVTTDEAGGYRVLEGHRRLAAAIKAGLAEVPCVLDASRADDQAGQYLDMFVANSADHRRNFTPAEEVAALFSAHELGATRTRIRKATGRKAEDIKTAIKAGGVSVGTREQMGSLAGQLTLDQLALVAEFDGDEEALPKILDALRRGLTADYVAERIRQERAEAAEHQRLRGELEAAGIQITDDLPDGAGRLSSLMHDHIDLTPESHADCPGRGAYFPAWALLHPVFYCADPAGNGHAYRHPFLAPHPAGAGSEVTPDTLPGSQDDPVPDPDRRLVIEGNRAWSAAVEVRKRWLQQLLARRSAPPEVARFVAAQLLAMPEPLRLGLATAHLKPLFAELTGQDAGKLAEGSGTCPAGRLPMLMLAPIVAAYEGEMYGADAGRRSTWRTDRFSPCPRADAGRYLAFLASLGYEMSDIERAVVEGQPYTGDVSLSDDQADTAGPAENGDAPAQVDGRPDDARTTSDPAVPEAS